VVARDAYYYIGVAYYRSMMIEGRGRKMILIEIRVEEEKTIITSSIG
jgi:hypothetical protein